MKRSRWWSALFLFAWAARAAAVEDPGPVRLTETKQQGAVLVEAENRDPDAVRWAWVELVGAQNVVPDTTLPAGFVLAPLEKRRLFTLRPQDTGQGYSYGLRTRTGEGDPTRDPDPATVYLLPWAHGTKHIVSQGYFGSVTHQGLHALDFDLAEGTEVDAARSGVVIGVKDDATEGGPSMQFAKDGNFVQVMHPDGTWAIYAHLQHLGAVVQKGQGITAGTPLGRSGHTGLASGPHLHFAVYRAGWDGPHTVPTVFLTGVSQTSSLEEGHTYYAYHPGGPAFTPVLGEDIREDDLRGITRTATGGKVTFREQRVDRRTLVWADNGTGRAIDLEVGFAEAVNVRPSVLLPYHAHIPARTEVYCFYVDFIGVGTSSYRLTARWHPSRTPGSAR